MNIELLIAIRGFLKISLIAGSFLMLNSCTDSKLAIELANSFDSPLENQDSKKLDEENLYKKPIARDPLIQSKISKKDEKSTFNTTSKKKNFNETSNPNKIDKSRKNKKKVTQFNPQPYRIIIRLSGANPSAPAETVTRALRDAGIIFEVEKIERFEKKSSLKKKLSEDNQF